MRTAARHGSRAADLHEDLTERDATAGSASRAPIDRRAALARLGTGAALAWSAPTILSAPAASASTIAPVCLVCDQPGIVVNGDASLGLTSWTVGGNFPVGVTAVDDLSGLLDATGGNVFFTMSWSSAAHFATLTQTIELGTGCDGALVDLRADLASGVELFLPDEDASADVVVVFVDASNHVLGTLGVDSPQGLPPVSLTTTTASGVIPTGAVRAVVTVSFVLKSANDDTFVFAAATGVALRISCAS